LSEKVLTVIGKNCLTFAQKGYEELIIKQTKDKGKLHYVFDTDSGGGIQRARFSGKGLVRAFL